MEAEGSPTFLEAVFSPLESLHVLQLRPPKPHSGTVVGRTGPGWLGRCLSCLHPGGPLYCLGQGLALCV